MNKLIKPYITIFGVFLVPSLGFVLIGWMIFNRLFRTRLPKAVPTEITSYGDVVYFLIFLGALINCIAIIYSLLKNPNPLIQEQVDPMVKKRFTKLGEWLTQKLTKFGEWYYGLYKSAYAVLLRLIVKLDVEETWALIIFPVGDYLVATATEKNMRWALVCVDIIPSLIVATVLFVDVYYFGKFHYFYISLYLMIIPVTWKVILYMVKEACESTCKDIQKDLVMAPNQTIIHEDGHYEWVYKIVEPHIKRDWQRDADLDIACRKILVVVDGFDDVRNGNRMLFLPARLLIGLIFLISWSLVIYKFF